MVMRKNLLKRVKRKRNLSIGILHVQATFNNTIATVTDAQGNVIGWSSTGKVGFKGSRKSTPYAAQTAIQDALSQATLCGMQSMAVKLRGVGVGKEAVFRVLQVSKIVVSYIEDRTYFPHNGARAPKRRRV